MELTAFVILAFGVALVSSFKSFEEAEQDYNLKHPKRHKMSLQGDANFKSTGFESLDKEDLENLKKFAPPARRVQALTKLPTFWDWEEKGHVSSPKNQGQCGSCWAFSVVGALESYYSRKGKGAFLLSEQQIVDCDQSNNGCVGGNPFPAFQYVARNGIEFADNYPYTDSKSRCAYSRNLVKLQPPKKFASITDETTMMKYLYQYGPFPICLYMHESFSNYPGGVLGVDECPAEPCPDKNCGHCVLLVGYGTDQDTGVPYWRIKNSWGADWGEGGFIRLARGQNTCKLLKQPAIAIIG